MHVSFYEFLAFVDENLIETLPIKLFLQQQDMFIIVASDN